MTSDVGTYHRAMFPAAMKEDESSACGLEESGRTHEDGTDIWREKTQEEGKPSIDCEERC